MQLYGPKKNVQVISLETTVFSPISTLTNIGFKAPTEGSKAFRAIAHCNAYGVWNARVWVYQSSKCFLCILYEI